MPKTATAHAPTPREERPSKVMNVRVPAAVLERINRVAAHLKASKNDVLIAVLKDGLEVVESGIIEPLTAADRKAIREADAAFARGEYCTLDDLEADLKADVARLRSHKAPKRSSAKVPR